MPHPAMSDLTRSVHGLTSAKGCRPVWCTEVKASIRQLESASNPLPSFMPASQGSAICALVTCIKATLARICLLDQVLCLQAEGQALAREPRDAGKMRTSRAQYLRIGESVRRRGMS